MAREGLENMSSPDQKMIETQESMEAIEEMRQQEDDLKNEMIANNDNGDPPRVFRINGGMNKSQSKAISVNDKKSDWKGVNKTSDYYQAGLSFNHSVFGIELGLQASNQKLDYKYIQDQTTTINGNLSLENLTGSIGGYVKAYVGVGGRNCYSCDIKDTDKDFGVGVFAELGIQKIFANGEIVCDCNKDLLHEERLVLKDMSAKIGLEIVLPRGVKVHGYRQKTNIGYKFRNDDFTIYMNGRGVGASIPLD